MKERDRVGVGLGTEQVVEGNNPRRGRGCCPPLPAMYPDSPLPCPPPSYRLRLFLMQTFTHINTPTFLKSSHSTPTCLWRRNRQSIPKRWHIKFRHRGITQKKAYIIQNTAKVWIRAVCRTSPAWVHSVELTVYSVTGEYASAIETLVTAISLIKQSKVANDDRCKILISSLQDTLHGVETKSYGSARRGKCSTFQINCVFFYLFL